MAAAESMFSAMSYIVEPIDLWSSCSPGGPAWSSGADGGYWTVDGEPVPIPAAQFEALSEQGTENLNAQLDRLPSEAFSADGRIKVQRAGRLSGEVLYPTPSLWSAIALTKDASAQLAWTRVYNDWLADYCSHDPDRLIGVAQIPAATNAAGATAELRRCLDLGLRAAQLRAIPRDQADSDEDVDRFWSLASDTGVPISIDSTFGPSRPRLLLGIGALGPVVPAAGGGAVALAQSGVLDRYPNLRFVVATATAGWVPPWLERTDDSFIRFSGLRAVNLNRPLPSDYLRGENFWYTFSGDDLIHAWPDTYISSKRLLWSSQYPTQYHTVPGDSVESSLRRYPDRARAAILSENCRSLYDTPADKGLTAQSLGLSALAHAVPA